MIEYLTPVSSALIGWLTNKMAIKMLFSPKEKTLGLQGLLIKRKRDLANSLSNVIVDRLLGSGGELLPKDKIDELLKYVAADLTRTICAEDVKSDSMREAIGWIVEKEIRNLVSQAPAMEPDSIETVKKTVSANIIAIPDQEIEDILTEIANKEFKSIELIGAIVGFLIGAINMLLLGGAT